MPLLQATMVRKKKADTEAPTASKPMEDEDNPPPPDIETETVEDPGNMPSLNDMNTLARALSLVLGPVIKDSIKEGLQDSIEETVRYFQPRDNTDRETAGGPGDSRLSYKSRRRPRLSRGRYIAHSRSLKLFVWKISQ